MRKLTIEIHRASDSRDIKPIHTISSADLESRLNSSPCKLVKGVLPDGFGTDTQGFITQLQEKEEVSENE